MQSSKIALIGKNLLNDNQLHNLITQKSFIIEKYNIEQLNRFIFSFHSSQISLLLVELNEELTAKNAIDLIRKNNILVPLVCLSYEDNVEEAIDAIKYGALDYIVCKNNSSDFSRIASYLEKYANYSSHMPVICDKHSQQILIKAQKVAETDFSVLISGESGTGKEVLAQFIHRVSSRSKENMVAVNCAAIPDNMLEATLFGYEKGAFTGAYQSTPGKFEIAQNGTILLDEISEMSLGLQAKLLRVLQEREVERLGSKKVIPLNIRIIATTNRNLEDEIKHNRFREDLYYRINVFPIRWKPLRERKDDIIPLAKHLLNKHVKKLNLNDVTFSQEVLDYFLSYSWPGNVRELDNVLQRALILKNGNTIVLADIVNEDENSIDDNEKLLSDDLKQKEYNIIIETLKLNNGDRKLTSQKLGISPRTLRYKIAKMKQDGMVINN